MNPATNPALDTLHALRDNWAAGGDMGRPDGFVAVREGGAEAFGGEAFGGEAYAVKIELWTDDCLMDLKKQDEAAARRRGEALAKKWAKEHWPHTGYVDLGGAEGVYGATWAWDKATENELERTDPDEVVRLPAARANPAARKPPASHPLDKDLYADVVAEAKSRFDVWPSAYASGWVVKTYKARGGRYAGGGARGLTKWFGEEWVDLSRPIHEDGELVGYEPCGRKTAQDASNDPAAYPKCRPLAEALRMSPSEVKDAIKRKRAAEAKAGRGAKGRGGRGARAPVRVSTYRTNPMRQPEDAPGFRIAVIEHQKPGAFKGRIILAAYTDDGQMLAWVAALPASLRSETSTSSGPRAAAFPELRGYNDFPHDDDDAVVWEVAKSHAWVDGWGPLLYEALLAFVASKGYSGWVTSDAGMTSKEARAVWRRFSERDDVEFQHDVGKNVNGQPIDAMRALPALLAKRTPLLKKLDRRAAYTRAVKQFLRNTSQDASGRFGVFDDADLRANPALRKKDFLALLAVPENRKAVEKFVDVVRAYQSDSAGYKSALANRYLALPASVQDAISEPKANLKKLYRGDDGKSRARATSWTSSLDYAKLFGQYVFPYAALASHGGTINTHKLVRLLDFAFEDHDVGDDEDEVVILEPVWKSADSDDGYLVKNVKGYWFPRENPDADAAARLGPVVDTEEWDDGTVVEFVAVPFPVERKPLSYKDDPEVSGFVRVEDLIATQRRVTKAGVEKYLDDLAGRVGRAEKIRIYETHDGRRYIADGHHRAVAAQAAGVEVLPAVIQLVRE